MMRSWVCGDDFLDVYFVAAYGGHVLDGGVQVRTQFGLDEFLLKGGNGDDLKFGQFVPGSP